MVIEVIYNYQRFACCSERVPSWTAAVACEQSVAGSKADNQTASFVSLVLGGDNGMLYVWATKGLGLVQSSNSSSPPSPAEASLVGVVELPVNVSTICNEIVARS